MTKSEQAIKEFAKKWGWGWCHSDTDYDDIMDDLTALLKEHYVPKEEAYPKEFVEWIGHDACRGYDPSVRCTKWYVWDKDGANLIDGENSPIYECETTDELYKWWEENVK